jgi:hypothetical protein
MARAKEKAEEGYRTVTVKSALDGSTREIQFCNDRELGSFKRFVALCSKKAPDGKPAFKPTEEVGIGLISAWDKGDDKRLEGFLKERAKRTRTFAEDYAETPQIKAKIEAKVPEKTAQ